jgi:tetratricopeptide (TPR) repeat protein
MNDPSKTKENSESSNVRSAITLVNEGKLDEAGALLKSLFERDPENIDVLRALAELGRRKGHLAESADLLKRAIVLKPEIDAARIDLLPILVRLHQNEDALKLAIDLSSRYPDNLDILNTRARLLVKLGDNEAAIPLLEKVLTRDFTRIWSWMIYGHCLKAVGRLDDCIGAYREALLLDPEFGDAWWSLANIKTVRFTTEDLKGIEAALTKSKKAPVDKAALHFAMAKALEDTGGDPQSIFSQYQEGNRIKRELFPYDRSAVRCFAEEAITVQTQEFFRVRNGKGCPSTAPLFIVGMPRSGSTLIEQILASHPMIEATNELQEITSLATRLARGQPDQGLHGAGYLARLSRMNAGQLLALGEEYLERTKIQRKTSRPFFIDKMPANWRHVGLIHLILPNAKIIDVRRNPMDCCFSNFKQNYGAGHHSSYDLIDMGSFYVNYVEYMARIDAVLPGKVYRSIHEKLIDEPEKEIAQLLQFIGVDIDQNCLEFWKTERAIKTPSSQQVRRPVNRDGIGQWLPFEPWLEPLKRVLGPVYADYPAVPDFN